MKIGWSEVLRIRKESLNEVLKRLVVGIVVGRILIIYWKVNNKRLILNDGYIWGFDFKLYLMWIVYKFKEILN